ncbi:toll/interleukin-1 receptor domain-containing protein [Streptomyces malaysiensis]|uniref:toll/interleukin-1 receptor domain-containing protein n=1 Tax=Streptomyces malaysiensis TaxID=92644 RepID=UPI003713F200
MEKYDLFISHASEDKGEFVRPLANELKSLGLNVWYDEFSLSVGDSLSASIDKGLIGSRYGVVVLSPSFLKKPWPEYEFRSLVTLESGKAKRILPVWHNVNRDDLLKYSPHLADKVALVPDGWSTLHVALEIIRVARPKLFSEIKRRVEARKHTESQVQNHPIGDIQKWPTLREPLTQPQLRRLRLVQEALIEVFPQSWEEMVSDFQRDSKEAREGEIRAWERIAGTYAFVCRRFDLDSSEKKRLFGYLVGASLRQDFPSGESQPEWVTVAAKDFTEPLPNARD